MPTTFIFNIQVSKTSSQTVIEEKLDIDPSFRLEEFTSNNGEVRFLRIEVDKAGPFKIHYEAIVDLQYQVINRQHLLETVPVSTLDAVVIPYLFPSRYCQSDKLQELVFREFGEIDNTFAKVSAITEWVYKNVSYKSGITNSSTSRGSQRRSGVRSSHAISPCFPSPIQSRKRSAWLASLARAIRQSSNPNSAAHALICPTIPLTDAP